MAGTAQINVEVFAGETGVLLSDAALAAGVRLDLCCGGNGVCGRCEVEWAGARVLACQTTAESAGRMVVPPESQLAEELAVETAFAPPVPRAAAPRCRRVTVPVASRHDLPGVDDWERVCRAAFAGGARPRISPALLRSLPEILEAGHAVRVTVLDGEVIALEDGTTPPAPVLGAAIDVGTTTVVVRLMDMTTGAQLSIGGAHNRQATLGANVISRIAAGSNVRGLQVLQELVAERTIAPLLEKCLADAGVPGATVWRSVCGGNTVMTHLLLGLPPQGLGSVPFNAVTLEPGPVDGTAIRLPMRSVESLPCAGAYIGGDVLGGVYALGLERSGPPELLMDIGTNSEMVLRVGDRLWGASAPAGPAFEGGGLTQGGPAGPGAVTHVKFTGEGFRIQTWRNTAPTHLCGSAYIELLAEGIRHGWLTGSGRFDGDAPFLLPPTVGDSATSHRGRRCRVAENVIVDEVDVSLLLQAKAAVLSGARILLRSAGIAPSELNALHVAGGFGRHLDPGSAMRIGLLPDVPLDRVRVVGNTSLAAASAALINAHAAADLSAIARRVTVIELNREPDFEECYIAALEIPE